MSNVDMPYVRKAVPKDAVYLALDMRKLDKLEIKYSHNIEPLDAVMSCLNLKNAKNYTITDDHGVIYGMFGVSDCPMQPRQGVVWLLCSDFIKSIPNSFYRECKSWINHLAEDYDSIYNFVYEKNWLALKWLQLSGFTVAKKLKVGPYKKNFYLIVKDKDEICATQQQSQ